MTKPCLSNRIDPTFPGLAMMLPLPQLSEPTMVHQVDYKTTEVSTKKKPGRKRTKLSKIDQLLINLPAGFTFLGPPGHCKKDYILEQLKDGPKKGGQDSISAQNCLEQTADTDSQTFRVGLFCINILEVSVANLKAMRKLLPRPEYKLLKNRKCARMSRFRRKEQTSEYEALNKQLQEENSQLRRQLGLPAADPKMLNLSADSSDDEQDSGGAETHQEIDERNLHSSFALSHDRSVLYEASNVQAQSKESNRLARAPFTANSALLRSVQLKPLDMLHIVPMDQLRLPMDQLRLPMDQLRLPMEQQRVMESAQSLQNGRERLQREDEASLES